jgi:fructokinase
VKVLSFGEILFDLIEGQHYLGGAPFNYVAHLAKMGVDAYIFSRLGKDQLGQEARERIGQLGVKSDFLQADEQHPSGTVTVSIREGQPTYHIHENVAYDYIDYDEAHTKLAGLSFDVLYFGSLIQRNQQSADSLKKLLKQHQFRQVFYDINLRKDCYTPDIIRESLGYCSIFKLNDEEVLELGEMLYQQQMKTEDFCQRLAADYQISLIVITAGAQGCYIFENDALTFVKGYPAKVVDTVGAGDSFSAAFTAFYLRKGDARQAADVANQLGAFVASSRGPIPEYSDQIRQTLQLD